MNCKIVFEHESELNNQKLAKTVAVVVVFTLIALFLAILANSVTKPIDHDEQMYCTAGALLAQGKIIYRDFSYVHMPYHPLLYASLFKVLNTSYFLLVGRLVSVVCDILVVVCIVGIYRLLFKSFAVMGLFLGLVASILWIFNRLVDYANGFAWNHDVVVLFVMVSFWLFVSTDFKRKSKYPRIAAIGALLTFAACMRITTFIVELLFFVVLLMQPAESTKQRLKNIVPFLIAAAIVLVWPAWLIAQAPQAFLLNQFYIQKLNDEWLHGIGIAHNKIGCAFESLTTFGYFAILTTGIYLCMVLILCRHKLKIVNKGKALLAFLVALSMFGIAFITPYTFRQYFAIPVPFLVVGFAYPFMWLREFNSIKYFKTGVIILIVGTVMTVTSNTIVMRRIPNFFSIDNWVPVKVHRISEDIAKKTKDPKLILTLAPLYAIEGGSDSYTEFSAGPFVYRIAELLTPLQREIVHAMRPGAIKELVELSPPSAVIVGVEQKDSFFDFSFLEDPLQAAVKADWESQSYDNGITVYFRP